ncbi:unnamed protein product, partial [Rotaria sp. Silwood1]
RPLEYSLQTKKKFQRNQVDTFIIEAVLLKQLRKIRIGHDGTENILISRWLAINENDQQIISETHANVHLQIFGGKTQTDYIQLNTIIYSINTFQCGSIDMFTIQYHDLGKITDEKFIDIQYEITVFTGDKVNVGSDANIFIQIFGLQNKTEEILLENKIGSFQRNSILIQRHLNQSFDERKRTFYPHIEEYWFICQQWFNNDQSNKQTIREYFPTKQNETLISFRKEVTYLIYVYTGDQIDAGTDANVFLTIYGQYEDSG